MNQSTGSPPWAERRLRVMRSELCRVVEPGDLMGWAAVTALGVERTHQLALGGEEPSPGEQEAAARQAAEAGLRRTAGLRDALKRWRTRAAQADGARDLAALEDFGGGLLIPEDAAWPQQLNDLQAAAPLGLYFRCRGSGRSTHPQQVYAAAADRLPRPGRCIAVVGAREMSDYGGQVAAELAEQLAAREVAVLSGGAYGVDAAAHRAALAAGTSGFASSVAVLAGGADRFYPAGNEPLLRSIADHGLLLTEMAPGSAPTRHRFLQRNRLIAALADAVVVVEARWRSGALSTAHHALELGRPVGAVPGSVYSASSAGCHRLLQQTPAQLVTDAAEVMQMVAAAALEQDPLPLPESSAQRHRSDPDPLEGLGEAERRIYDALPARRLTTAGRLSQVAGLAMPQVLSGLSRLQRRGLAAETNGQWGRARPPAP
ncbi:DNA-processing protein DprA [Nesterenkonia sp.]|uniref:DNA-processing protein DprA n=1 Tax=Nesterenkonia sp. TaxID=704201 RepID=UPI0026215420|nr:DNA-processing protein DprA [Nesterenkonia sp.]